VVYDQREVVLIPFPYTDLTGTKQRPALIISNAKINNSVDRICCLITSNNPKDGIVLDTMEQGKLPFKSWVKPYRIFTIHTRIIRKRICKITPRLHHKILSRINEFIE
jgi:mRNA interferase MazF